MATVLSTLIGVTLGLIAGFAGGLIDSVISFVTDLFFTLPFLVAALAIAPIIADRWGTNVELYNKLTFWTLVAILVIFGWMGIARLVRGEVLSLREREFVKAARVLGVPTHRILIREVLPNLIAPIVVSISLALPLFVSAEAGLSFLGIGVQGRPSWGQTIATATKYWETYPLFLWEPVIGITVLCVALNLLGDAIRDAFDPKTRR
jgi:peptide/nickel transport system permease protein